MSFYSQPNYYQSLLGISSIDAVNSNTINTTNITTQNLTVSSLGSGLVSSDTSGTLQNAIIGLGLSYSSVTNTLNNTGLTSITSGATGPVYISTSSTGSVHIALPQNLTPTSGVEFSTVTTIGDVNSGGYLYSGALSGGGANNSLAVIDEGTVYSLGGNIVAPIQYDWANGLRISLTGSTGIDYTVRGNTGYITNKNITGATGPIGPIGPTGPIGFTGYTGPMGVPGVGGTIGYYANYYSTTTQSIGTSAQQITFPNHFVQNGISLDGSNNIVFSASGTYKITTLLQVNGSNNARFYHWYRYNGADVGNSAYEDHFSSGAGQVLSNSSGLITVNAGDTLGLWGVKTAGTISIEYTPGSVSPVYPASTSVNVVVSQETYTQIGPTGYTGPMGPVYTAGTNINISGGNVISTSLYPQFDSIRDSSIGTQNTLLNGFNYVSPVGAGGNTLIGSFAGFNVTTGGKNIAIGLGALYGGNTNLTASDGQNIGIGTSAMSTLEGTASYNVGLGPYVANNLTTGSNNLLIGLNAGGNISTSSNNISIGNYSMGLGSTKLTNATGANVAIGNYAGYSINATGTYNSLLGSNSGQYLTTGSYNSGIGYTSLGGITTGSYNVAIGYNTLTGLTTGSNNVHIGLNTQSRIQNAQRAIVISAQTTTSVDKGDDTAFINCPSGLYSYSPAYWWGYAKTQTSGIIEWIPYNDRKAIALKVGDATQLLLPYIGLYEIALSGSIYVGSASQNLDMYVNGSLYLQNACFFQTITGWTSCSLNVIVPAYTVNTYVQFTLSGSLGTATSIQLFLKAKFLSLM